MRLLIYLALVGLSSQDPPNTPFYRTIFPSHSFTFDELPTEVPLDKATESYRLSNSVIPLHYDLYINTFFEPNFNYFGTVQITLSVPTKTDSFRFHANLNLQSIRLIDSKGSYLAIKVTTDTKKQWREVKIDLQKGTYKLEVEFNKTLSIPGYFKSNYMVGKVQKWVSSTHFEPTNARSAFPCFDEPNLKATFNISLEHDPEHKAFANTPINNVVITPENRRVTHFETTPKMSTYLIAYALADYDETVKKDRTRVLARTEIKPTLTYALETGDKVLNGFEKLLGVKFPIGKMDHIAITQGMNGAMENFGLITYSESALQSDETDTMAGKKGVTTIIAHELAHQWFGDIVTMDWWDDIWLNEGFATYFSYRILQEVDPSWNPIELFALHVRLNVIRRDTGYMRALDKPAETPNEISSLFDDIGYSKGGSLLYMFEHCFGSKAFIEGLTSYLTTNSFKNAKTKDLWAAWQSSVDKNKVDLQGLKVRDIGNSWIQAGYPIVNVIYDATSNTAKFTQDRFIFNENEEWVTDPTKWIVPITVIHPETKDPMKTTPDFWLTDKTTEKNGIAKAGSKWIVVNNNQTGFYRVNYTIQHWEALQDYLVKTPRPILSELTISQLIDDASFMALYGQISYSVPLGLTRFLARETGYTLWFSTFNLYYYIDERIRMSPGYPKFKAYFAYIINKAYKSAPLMSTPQLLTKMEKYKKELILEPALWTENAQLTADAVKLFDGVLTGDIAGKDLAPDEKLTIYCASARYDSKLAEKLVGNYQANTALNLTIIKDENFILYRAVACASDPKYLNKLIADILDNKVFVADKVEILGRLAEKNGIFMFEHFRQNYKNYEKSLTSGLWSVTRKITEHLATQEQLHQLKELASQPYVQKDMFEEPLKKAEASVLWNKQNQGLHDWIGKEPVPVDPEVTTTSTTTISTSTVSTSTVSTSTVSTSSTTPTPPSSTKKPGSAFAIKVNLGIILGLFVFVMIAK